MGDLEKDTAVEQVGAGHYRAVLSREWEIWGPMGGYVASVALRAVAGESPFARPASFFCHYLGVAKFDAVDIRVTELRRAKTAAAHRAEVTQDGRPILEATVWSIGDVDGLDHVSVAPPDVPGPDDLKTVAEHFADAGVEAQRPPFPFWDNFVTKPLDFQVEWPPRGPQPPVWRQWHRFEPTATFAEPWVDACRALVLVDIQSWPAAHRPHAWRDHGFIAPSLDLYVAFNDPVPDSEWLLADGDAPLARDGLMAWNGRLWSSDRRLVASGQGQLLCRRIPTAPT